MSSSKSSSTCERVDPGAHNLYRKMPHFAGASPPNRDFWCVHCLLPERWHVNHKCLFSAVKALPYHRKCNNCNRFGYNRLLEWRCTCVYAVNLSEKGYRIDPDADLWHTQDGRVIHVHKMTDDHLLNTLAYFSKRHLQNPKMPEPRFVQGYIAVEMEAAVRGLISINWSVRQSNEW